MSLKENIIPLRSSQKYLMGHMVVVLYEYQKYGLAKVRYRNSDEEFIIDTKSLSDTPISEHTINLGLLEGN